MPDLPQRRNPRRFVGESYRDCVDRLAGELSATEKDRDALQARIEKLEEANAAVEEENDLLRDVIQQKHARFEVLTVALTEIAANRCEDRHDWCSKEEAPREDWCNPCIARAALVAGETESEAPKQ